MLSKASSEPLSGLMTLEDQEGKKIPVIDQGLPNTRIAQLKKDPRWCDLPPTVREKFRTITKSMKVHDNIYTHRRYRRILKYIGLPECWCGSQGIPSTCDIKDIATAAPIPTANGMVMGSYTPWIPQLKYPCDQPDEIPIRLDPRAISKLDWKGVANLLHSVPTE